MFYIHKQQVTRICDLTSFSSINGLKSCDLTRQACVTYSKNRQYAYKCQETDASQERRGKGRSSFFFWTPPKWINVFFVKLVFILIGLPLCIHTEDTTERPSVRDPIYLHTTAKLTKTVHLTSSAEVHTSITLLTFLSLIL